MWQICQTDNAMCDVCHTGVSDKCCLSDTRQTNERQKMADSETASVEEVLQHRRLAEDDAMCNVCQTPYVRQKLSVRQRSESRWLIAELLQVEAVLQPRRLAEVAVRQLSDSI